MITARPYSVLRVCEDARTRGIRFTLAIHTSLGLHYERGWRFFNGRLHPPSVHLGGARYMAITKPSKHGLSLIRKLAFRALAQLERSSPQEPALAASSESHTP